MSIEDAASGTAGTPATPRKKAFNTRYVNGRIARILAASDMKRKRRNMASLAQRILTEIATGTVRDPVAVSQAFAAGMATITPAGLPGGTDE